MKREEVECCEELLVHDQKVQEVLKEMPSEETLKELADFYKVFGDATRVKILFVLLQAEMCVCDLAETLGMTQSAISHQLRVLKQMKLVKNRREGKTVYYSLADGHIQNIISQGMEHILECFTYSYNKEKKYDSGVEKEKYYLWSRSIYLRVCYRDNYV